MFLFIVFKNNNCTLGFSLEDERVASPCLQAGALTVHLCVYPSFLDSLVEVLESVSNGYSFIFLRDFSAHVSNDTY